jgi:O-antigen ligase
MDIGSARAAAYLAGLADVSAALSYLAGVNISVWHGATLLFKLLVVVWFRVPGGRTLSFHLPAVLAFAALLVLSAWGVSPGPSVWAAMTGFCLHLVVTLAAMRFEQLRTYLKAVAQGGMILALLFIAMVAAGMMESTLGRFSFFGGAHPNLGSEILAMAVVAASMSLRMRGFIIVALAGFVGIVLMQGRAAVLVVLLCGLVRLLQWTSRGRKLIPALVLLVIGSGAAFSVPALRTAASAASQVLLLVEDEHRGVGSGFGGREDRWRGAWEAFAESPLLGQGYGSYAEREDETPHNFFLYCLSQFGLLSIPILAYGAWCLYRGYRKDPELLLQFAPVGVLLMFNDRFINLNAYPFVMIVSVLMMGSRAGSSESSAEGVGSPPAAGVT